MSESTRRLLPGALLTATLFLGTSPTARACSVCLAGDPYLASGSASGQAAGQVSLYLEGRGWTKQSGLLPDEDPDGKEKNDSQRLDLYASWTPLDRLTLTLDLPWAFNQVTEIEDGEHTTSRLSGFGDLSLSASGVLWRNRDVLPSSWLEGRAFLKFPTGESHESVHGVADPHIQPGTGSWDFGFGLAGVQRLEKASLYASALYRVNTPGSLGYEYGDVVLATAAAEVPLGHAFGIPWLERFTLGGGLDFRWTASDHSHGQRYHSSGGAILFASPSLRVRLPWWGPGRAPSLRAGVQIPFTSGWLRGYQDEDPVWSAGLQYSF
jgi:hypothetical protein